jgi:SanA protein
MIPTPFKRFLHWLGLAILFLSVVWALVFPWWVYRTYTGRMWVSVEAVSSVPVAIVFGAGIKANGTPSDALRDRLDTTVELWRAGKVARVLVSGDNRFVEHNEPEVMEKYLMAQGVSAEAIHKDFAGRRTYDTCWRARHIWQVSEALLISQGYHVPRAMWLCEQMGMRVHGLSATRHTYVKGPWFKAREWMGLLGAWVDVYIRHPAVIGGEQEAWK